MASDTSIWSADLEHGANTNLKTIFSKWWQNCPAVGSTFGHWASCYIRWSTFWRWRKFQIKTSTDIILLYHLKFKPFETVSYRTSICQLYFLIKIRENNSFVHFKWPIFIKFRSIYGTYQKFQCQIYLVTWFQMFRKVKSSLETPFKYVFFSLLTFF